MSNTGTASVEGRLIKTLVLSRTDLFWAGTALHCCIISSLILISCEKSQISSRTWFINQSDNALTGPVCIALLSTHWNTFKFKNLVAAEFCVPPSSLLQPTNSNKVQFYVHKNTSHDNKANWSYFGDCYPELYDSIVEVLAHLWTSRDHLQYFNSTKQMSQKANTATTL